MKKEETEEPRLLSVKESRELGNNQTAAELINSLVANGEGEMK